MGKIVVRLYGGLGNQIFQYCAGRRLAIITSSELVLDVESGFKRDSKYSRKYALGNLNIQGREALPNERLEPFERLRRFTIKRLQPFIPQRRRTYITESMSDIFSKKRLPTNKPICLDGYWQTSTHFLAHELLLRSELSLKKGVATPIMGLQGELNSEQSVAIHIRWFGKDAEFSETNFGEDYYRKAVNRIKELVQFPKFYVFSDKPEMACQLLNKLNIDFRLISEMISNISAEQEMFLMSACKHKIIGNSTYGWWAAALGERSDTKVICPRSMCFSGIEWGKENMLLDNWIKL
jgi:hypothetical protein